MRVAQNEDCLIRSQSISSPKLPILCPWSPAEERKHRWPVHHRPHTHSLSYLHTDTNLHASCLWIVWETGVHMEKHMQTHDYALLKQ